MSAAALAGQGTSRRRILIVSSAIGLLTALLAVTPFGAYLDRLGIDLLQPVRLRLSPPKADPAQSPIAIVAIDEESYAALGNFPKVVWTPWLAQVMEALLQAKVRTIALDVVFPTTLDAFVFEGKRPLAGIDIPFLQAINDAATDNRILLGSAHGGSIAPHPSQIMAANGTDNLVLLNLELDTDGVVRSYPASLPTIDGHGQISLAYALATRAGIKPPGHDTLVDFAYGPGHIPAYSLADLLDCAKAGKESFFDAHFAGKSVIFADVLDSEDRFFTSASLMTAGGLSELPPASQPRCMPAAAAPASIGVSGRWKIPGVFVHATAFQNLVQGTAITPLPRLPGAVGVGLIAFAAALGFYAVTPLIGAAAGVAAILLMALAGAFALGQELLLPAVTAWFGVSLAYLMTAGDRVIVEQRNRQRVMDIFGTFLAPAVVKKLAADPRALAPVRRHATIMFIDIVGYTSLTESLKREPDRLIGLINEYLGLLADIISKHGGYVDKFIGDAVLAVWNVPTVERSDAGRAAAEAALECAELVRAKGRARSDGIKVDVRIGIASGEVTAGLVGSTTKANYTVLGDVVNLASRMESSNKLFGTHMMCCGATEADFAKAEAGHVSIRRRRLGRVQFKGKSEGIDVYELLDRQDGMPEEGNGFAAAVALYEDGRLAAAAAAFRAMADHEPPARLYLEQIAELERAPTRPEHPTIILHEK
ncbi:MAG TPA: adenylate/guanylate cyclase domain-containing protein [Dongiaceae bacterium]|nr:adenylate/guanylate cyclase domain-containing protein [Dongiaceae bacterium]